MLKDIEIPDCKHCGGKGQIDTQQTFYTAAHIFRVSCACGMRTAWVPHMMVAVDIWINTAKGEL